PRAVAAPDDLAARADCQVGCLLSGVAADNAMASRVDAVGHVVGGRYGLPHGVAHGILLLPALRLLWPELDDGLPPGAAGLAEDLAALLAGLPLPRRLREAGVGAADLPGLAAAAMGDHMIAYTPRPGGGTAGRGLLAAPWESNQGGSPSGSGSTSGAPSPTSSRSATTERCPRARSPPAPTTTRERSSRACASSAATPGSARTPSPASSTGPPSPPTSSWSEPAP